MGLLVYLQVHLPSFFKKCGVDYNEYVGIIGAYSDKCRGHMKLWNDNNIPFQHGVMIYMLGHTKEYAYHGSDIGEWVVGMYHLVKDKIQ